jgi:hypothetical protein
MPTFFDIIENLRELVNTGRFMILHIKALLDTRKLALARDYLAQLPLPFIDHHVSLMRQDAYDIPAPRQVYALLHLLEDVVEEIRWLGEALEVMQDRMDAKVRAQAREDPLE